MDAISISKGLHMLAISNAGPYNMLAMSKIDLESRDYDFWTNLAK